VAKYHGSGETREPGRYEFHYDREERLAMASTDLKSRLAPQSFFKRYRGPLFIFFDVVIIVGMFAIYLFISGGPSNSSFEGYAVSLSGVQFGSQALVVVRITRTKDRSDLSGQIVEATVAVEGTSLRKSDKDILPDKTGQARTFRFVLEPLPGGSGGKAAQVVATLSVGEVSRKLSTALKPE